MNTHQLVIRCDTTNGYYKVGWASELPLGRFSHIELLLEVDHLLAVDLMDSADCHFKTFSDACKRVSVLNQSLIYQEQHNNISSGWLNVSLNLNDKMIDITADAYGCFNNLAIKTRYRLSKNCRVVWAVITDHAVVHIEARYPERQMDEFKYQIWKQHKLAKLKEVGSQLKQGKLIVGHSGLWFVAKDSV